MNIEHSEHKAMSEYSAKAATKNKRSSPLFSAFSCLTLESNTFSVTEVERIRISPFEDKQMSNKTG